MYRQHKNITIYIAVIVTAFCMLFWSSVKGVRVWGDDNDKKDTRINNSRTFYHK